jgi:hypothetical protein
VEVAGAAETLRVTSRLPWTSPHERSARGELCVVPNDQGVGPTVESQCYGPSIVSVLNEFEGHNAVALKSLQGLLNVSAEVGLVVKRGDGGRSLYGLRLWQLLYPSHKVTHTHNDNIDYIEIDR